MLFFLPLLLLLLRYFVLFFLVFRTHRVSGLAFEPIGGQYEAGAQVTVDWTLDGSEPADGWQLWFAAEGSGIKLADIQPQALSAVVSFPGNGNGTFQGLNGLVLLAQSNEVDLLQDPTAASIVTTATFSPSVISGSTFTSIPTPSRTTSSVPVATSSNTPVKTSNGVSSSALLGVIVGTLVVIALIIFFSISLFVYRRRRVTENFTFGKTPIDDPEKHLAMKISPFSVQVDEDDDDVDPPPPRTMPARNTSLPRSGSLPVTSSSRRQAYLNTQLQQLSAPPPPAVGEDSGSIVFSLLSSVPSEQTARPFDLPLPRSAPAHGGSPPLPPLPLPTPEPSSRRAAYLSEQLLKLEVPGVRRGSDGGSVVFAPLSSVPSESTNREREQERERSPVSTVTVSPVVFRSAESLMSATSRLGGQRAQSN